MVSLAVRWLMACVLASTAGLALTGSAAAEPAARVELGSINVEHGLSCLNARDGQNEPATVGGEDCRRNVLTSDPPSRHFYFDYHPAAGRLRRPVYVTVEYFDEGFGAFRIQYDSADLGAPERGACKDGAAEVLLDSRKWRKVTFELPDARFDGRQSLGADFRLLSSGALAVRKVTVEMERSADFDLPPQTRLERVAACVGRLVPPRGVQVAFTAGGDEHPDLPTLAPIVKALGGTSWESQVVWDEVQPRSEHWDWRACDSTVSILRENGLKWSPRVTVGTGQTAPKWFSDSPDSVPAVCLEHGRPGAGQSIWNPKLRDLIAGYMAEFSSHYGPTGCVEALLIDLSGRPEPSPEAADQRHSHPGFWCGDRYACSDFRRWAEERYGDIGALNAAWGTSLSGFDEVAPFVPDSSRAARARLDLIGWYQDRMTNWASCWLAAARKCFPKTDIYLCIGPGGAAEPGLDVTALCRAAGRYQAGICVTREGPDFAATRLDVSAAKFYGACSAVEPASSVSAMGVRESVFAAAASAARRLHVHASGILSQPEGISAWSGAYRWLAAKETQRLPVAVFQPETAFTQGKSEFSGKAKLLRDALDFDLVDGSMIRDGALAGCKVLVLIEGGTMERQDASMIIAWVKSGGVVVACDPAALRTVEGEPALAPGLFDVGEDRPPTVKALGSGLALYVPARWQEGPKAAAGVARPLASLSTRAQTNLVPDGVVDGIYMSDLGGRLLIFNSTDSEQERDLQVSIGRRRHIRLRPGEIAQIQE